MNESKTNSSIESELELNSTSKSNSELNDSLNTSSIESEESKKKSNNESKIKKNNLDLINIFKNNINALPPDKAIIQNVKNNLNTKKDIQYFFNAIELLNNDAVKNNTNKSYEYLYPHLDDEMFSIKIANKREFNDNKYNVKIDNDTNIEDESNKSCNKEFQLAPHQRFLRNFLSIHTPYNGILLYHGLGTGKTCSAIGIAEETRMYLKYNNISNRIFIIASPNVQQNFLLQLFDENKLKFIDNKWNLENCVGNEILKDINNFDSNISKETIVKNIYNLINNYYVFMGYIEFANLITKKSNIDKLSKDLTNIEKNKLVKKKLESFFNNRLIIIDEIHNIRNSQDNDDKIISQKLMLLLKNVKTIKLVLMSATPMFNDYKEIIYLLNVLNLNDNRSTIEFSDVFNQDGSFIKDDDENEIGKELLIRKMNGYISYVKGDNPLTFPYRILPELFKNEKSIKSIKYPIFDINNNRLIEKINFFDLYCNTLSNYQEKVYNYIVSNINFSNLESYNYTLLQKPLEALIISFPNNILYETKEEDFNKIDIPIKDLVGKNGLSKIMNHDESNEPPSKYNYRFKDASMENIFLLKNINKYSSKIFSTLENIYNSDGPIIIYSQFIDGGIIPMALALEANGFTRYGNNRNLFHDDITKSIDKIDALTYKKKSEFKSHEKFNPANYILITGDKKLSSNIKKDLNVCTNIDNINGKNIKVILLTMAGSEGIDFKFIRQVHILEPWYNINRLEQIIGRAVRTCSHKDLEFKKRNVKIYMHTTILNDKTKESVDNLLYRKCENKAKKIGVITRLLKENSIDCHLNNELNKFSEENLNKFFKTGFNIILSNNEIINYKIGDKSMTSLCDYMESCEYVCKNSSLFIKDDEKLDIKTYSEKHMNLNNDLIIKELNYLFKEKFLYKKDELLLYFINKNYSKLLINNVLTNIIDNKLSVIKDKYNTEGYIINIDDLYIFQPKLIHNKNSSLFTKINPKNENINYLSYKVPETIEKIVPIKVVKNFQEQHDIDDTDKENIKYNDKIFDNIFKIYYSIINIDKDYEKSLVKNSYYKLLIDFLNIEKNINNLFIDFNNTSLFEETNKINYIYIKYIICNIIFDLLQLNELINIVKFVYLNIDTYKSEEQEKNVFFSIIKKIVNDNCITKKNTDYFVTYFKNDIFNYSIYKIVKQEGKIELVLGEYTDYEMLKDELIEKYKIDVSNYGIIVGFINNINKNNYELKLKTLKDPNNDKIYNEGTICSNLSKKEIKNRFIEKILPKSLFDKFYNLKNYKSPSYCLIIEIYLRFFNIINYNNKVWFINNLIKID
tara:strand:+ start:17395 stop:21315 length:3921 start_codon:yes stop_codon:yes gene_type:complete